MKLLFKIILTVVILLVVMIAIIKHVAKCSWKDAFGIIEQLAKEVKGSCCVCSEREE
jgi:hypothetical protein